MLQSTLTAEFIKQKASYLRPITTQIDDKDSPTVKFSPWVGFDDLPGLVFKYKIYLGTHREMLIVKDENENKGYPHLTFWLSNYGNGVVFIYNAHYSFWEGYGNIDRTNFSPYEPNSFLPVLEVIRTKRIEDYFLYKGLFVQDVNKLKDLPLSVVTENSYVAVRESQDNLFVIATIRSRYQIKDGKKKFLLKIDPNERAEIQSLLDQLDPPIRFFYEALNCRKTTQGILMYPDISEGIEFPIVVQQKEQVNHPLNKDDIVFLTFIFQLKEVKWKSDKFWAPEKKVESYNCKSVAQINHLEAA